MLKIGFIGFGLIGGSLAKCWRKAYPDAWIHVYNHSAKVPEELHAAIREGVINATEDALSGFSDTDVLVLCPPVAAISGYLKKLKDITLKETCIITDVGSVKSSVMDEADRAGLSDRFIGGHPMAGSEKSGYFHASMTLFENAYFILTPFRHTNKEKLESLKKLILDTKAVPVIMEAKRHDEVTAAISHVPHIAASSLVNAVAKKGDDMMELLAAGGFRDITRIASSSPEMWRDICLTNRESVEDFLDSYINELERIRDTIRNEKGSALFHFFENSKEFRDSLPLKKSNMAVSHEVLLYVPDQTGELAIISSILAARGISIKNMGIAHNREYADGVLRIEFYNRASLEAGITAIRERNYKVFEK